MSDLIQIATPVTPRDYNTPGQNHGRQDVQQSGSSGEVFDLGNQMQVVKTNDRSGERAEQNLKDDTGGLVRASSDAIKNPSSALDMAKDLISREAIALIRETGDTETLAKITEFASEVMLTPESLTADMAAQQKNATVFGDQLWNVLKNIIDMTADGTAAIYSGEEAAAASPGMAEQVGDAAVSPEGAAIPADGTDIPPQTRQPARPLVFSGGRQEVTPEGLAMSKEFTSAVADFAKAAADISAKDEILKSLSANFKYLSTAAAPSKAVSEELAAASNALSGTDAARNFTALKPTLLKLLGYTENSLLLDDNTKNLLPLIVHTMSRYNDNPDALRESFESLLMLAEGIKVPPESMEKAGLDPGLSLTENLENLFDSYVTKNEALSPEIKQASLFNSETAAHESQLRSAVNLLAAGAKHMAARIPEGTLGENIGTVDFTQGAEALRKVLASVIPNTPAMRTALQTIFDELEESRDLNAMVSRLNHIIENMGPENSDNMLKLAQGLNSALGEMAKNGTYTVSTATSMETLTDFISKNINNSFLHSLSGATSSDMVQNMLTAPGVFNPLLHSFIPLDAFGVRAFGEMWIDPRADELAESRKKGRGAADQGGSHIFICFDIEDTGYFELEIYEKEKNMTVMLLCPEKMEGSFEPIKNVIPKIAAENGYKVTASMVEPMKQRRTLDQVFPKINSQRSGLNVKI